MKLLLDTHVWIWAFTDVGRLAPRISEELQDQNNEVWLSPISIWEFLILTDKGRLNLKMDRDAWVAGATRAPIKEAPLTVEVVLATKKLHLSHHDPADIFLAATAKVFDLTLVTSDTRLLAVKEISVLRG